MGRTVTVTLPESLYTQFEGWAQVARRPVADLLLDAARQVLPQAHINPKRPLMQQQVAAFDAMREKLLAQFAGEFVALKEGRVVDHDTDQLALAERVSQQHATEVVLIKQVLPDSPSVLHFRSPRMSQTT